MGLFLVSWWDEIHDYLMKLFNQCSSLPTTKTNLLTDLFIIWKILKYHANSVSKSVIVSWDVFLNAKIVMFVWSEEVAGGVIEVFRVWSRTFRKNEYFETLYIITHFKFFKLDIFLFNIFLKVNLISLIEREDKNDYIFPL